MISALNFGDTNKYELLSEEKILPSFAKYYQQSINQSMVEIVCSKSTNVIVGCIYKHPALQINDFKGDFISPLLLKLQKEFSKRIFLLGDFNIDLISTFRFN